MEPPATHTNMEPLPFSPCPPGGPNGTAPRPEPTAPAGGSPGARLRYWCLAVPALLALAWVTWRVSFDWQDAVALRGSAVARTVAEVTAHQDEGTLECKVRYRFRAGEQWYSHSDCTGRRNLWARLRTWGSGPLHEQEKAGKPLTVDVRYLPQNPWANEPVERAGDPVESGLGGFIAVGLFCLLIAAAIVRRGIRLHAAR